MDNTGLFSEQKFVSAQLWQNWLIMNYKTSKGIWLLIAKKNSEEPTVTYAEALDDALCFGWIDGQKKPYDEQFRMQKFVPRKAESIWSKKNIEHAERLIKEGKMKAAGLKAIEEAKTNGNWQSAYDAQSNMKIPEDFLAALYKNKKATRFYNALNRTNLFSIYFRLQTSKKEETRNSRIRLIMICLQRERSFIKVQFILNIIFSQPYQQV